MSTESVKARLAAATPGPWTADWTTDVWERPSLFAGHRDSYVVPGVAACGRTKGGWNDATFIAHARTDLELALEVIEALRASDVSHTGTDWPCALCAALDRWDAAP